ncbi:MAG TPA: MarR family transcriptional regulator [Acidisoma sp.]|uniref:MarR family winged helix-turn-helix transcriptional regulator n=1 Tax=Acidisoma sp. TaxID=1872115 RepID=UPI002B96B3C9|nr:MarR family transcriptional regulator [Acidisoma sp.]HTI03639.1 MarR family transcriptional regulator [Acidisoma sp.]
MADTPDRMPDLSEFLCFAVYSTNHAFNRVYKPLLETLGLTYPQYLVMVQLWAEDGQTVGALGGRLFLESNTLTPLIKRLEAQGLVRRARDPADERQVRVALTETGRALEARALSVPACVFAATGMELPRLQRLVEDMTALRTALMETMEEGEAER